MTIEDEEKCIMFLVINDKSFENNFPMPYTYQLTHF